MYIKRGEEIATDVEKRKAKKIEKNQKSGHTYFYEEKRGIYILNY